MAKILSIKQLTAFIIQAKATTYVGDGVKSLSCRPGSHDLQFKDTTFSYLDSYFGNSDFLGQEVVYFNDLPVWGMNYYGRILKPAQITAAEAGQVIKESLSLMYKENRFLGGFEHSTNGFTYIDTNEGDIASFTGKEWITHKNIKVYELIYHGGLLKE